LPLTPTVPGDSLVAVNDDGAQPDSETLNIPCLP
jgi:hypothetical protein